MKGPQPESELDELDREGLDVRLEPVGDGGGELPVATLVLIDCAARNDGVAGRGDVTIG